MHGIIVGGGIVGLTTALTLHRAGISVTVYEEAPSIKELGVGLNLLPHSVKHLVDLGLQPHLDANGVRTGELRFFCKNGKAIWIVITTGAIGLCVGCAPKLTAPPNQSVFE